MGSGGFDREAGGRTWMPGERRAAEWAPRFAAIYAVHTVHTGHAVHTVHTVHTVLALTKDETGKNLKIEFFTKTDLFIIQVEIGEV